MTGAAAGAAAAAAAATTVAAHHLLIALHARPLARVQVASALGGDVGGDEAVGRAEEGPEGHEVGAEDAEEELGGGPPDNGDEGV